MKKLGPIVFCLVTVAGLWAQGEPKRVAFSPGDMVQHRVKFLTTILSLNAAQQQQATTIFTNAANAQKSVHENMRDARKALDTAVKNNDSGAIDQAASQIGTLTGQLLAIRSKADAAFTQILTPDQQAKEGALHGRGHGRGPGMMFGPPPPGADVFMMRIEE